MLSHSRKRQNSGATISNHRDYPDFQKQIAATAAATIDKYEMASE